MKDLDIALSTILERSFTAEELTEFLADFSAGTDFGEGDQVENFLTKIQSFIYGEVEAGIMKRRSANIEEDAKAEFEQKYQK